MKKIFVVFLVCLTISAHAQTSLAASTGRIAGSNIVLNNLSKSDFDKIMTGSIFDVFTLDLRASDYNTDLKKQTFLGTNSGKDYQARLETLRNNVRSQGIRTTQRQTGETTRDTTCKISNYDVNKRGFTITLDGGSSNVPGFRPRFNGFEIPGLKFSGNTRFEFTSQIFVPVTINAAQKIEGNGRVAVQFQLDANSFAIQKVFLVNETTNEVYAEGLYENLTLEEPREQTYAEMGPSLPSWW